MALAAYRLTRLIGWDEFPLIERIRAWLVGQEWVQADDVDLPGKTPESKIDDVRPAYRRPVLAHLIHCPFCLGWWVCLAAYILWLVLPTAALVIAVPLALSGAVGLLAKNLDA